MFSLYYNETHTIKKKVEALTEPLAAWSPNGIEPTMANAFKDITSNTQNQNNNSNNNSNNNEKSIQNNENEINENITNLQIHDNNSNNNKMEIENPNTNQNMINDKQNTMINNNNNSNNQNQQNNNNLNNNNYNPYNQYMTSQMQMPMSPPLHTMSLPVTPVSTIHMSSQPNSDTAGNMQMQQAYHQSSYYNYPQTAMLHNNYNMSAYNHINMQQMPQTSPPPTNSYQSFQQNNTNNQ